MISRLAIICLTILVSTPKAQSQSAEGIVISRHALDPERLKESYGLLLLKEGWRYSSGDQAEWADPGFDDSSWDTFTYLPDPWTQPENIDWTGVGWLRLRLKFDSTLSVLPLALHYFQIGAGEIYMDGKKIKSFGKVGDSAETEETHIVSINHPEIIPIRISGGEHLLAVRYSNFWALDHKHLKSPSWVGFGLTELADGIDRNVALNRSHTGYQHFFTGVCLAFTLLHFLLYLFYPAARENLHYSLFAGSMSLLAFTPFQVGLQTDPNRFLWFFWIFKVALILTALFGIRFLYFVFFGACPRFFRIPLVVGILLLLSCWALPLDYIYVFVILSFPEMLRIVFLGICHRKRGARIIGAGCVAFILACTYQMLMELGILDQDFSFAYVYGILALLVSMSIHLARSFARTNQDLKDQLMQVEALSEKTREQERQAQEQETARKLLEADNALKVKELEEARKRQEILVELEKTNRELTETQGQLVQSEKMAALGNLVAGVAHEINTPVGAINSMHDTLMRAVDRLKEGLENQLPKEVRDNRLIQSALRVISDANRVIATGTERVTEIVRSLRSFARLDEAEMKAADLHEGIDDTLTLIHHDLKNRIEVVKDYGDIPQIMCWPSRLNQVFLNILVNAGQAIRDKGQITIRTFQKDGKIQVTITDTGEGISEDNLKKVFDPGFTTKGVRIGTGLGLSICYQIVQDHRGEIRVESRVGEGTAFTIILPTDLDESVGKG